MATTVPAFASSIVKDSTEARVLELKSEQMVSRLQEIKEMDKSGLTRSERKDLRKEVKGLKKEMKAISGGVYLSVGAIIIIILLLILIL